MSNTGILLGQKLGQALLGGAYDDAYAKSSKDLAQQAAYMSTAQLNKAKTDELNQRAQYRTPEFASKLAGQLAGLTAPQSSALADYNRTGGWGSDIESMPVDVAGPPRVTPKAAPEWATPDTVSRYTSALGAAFANLAGTGDSNASQISKFYADALDKARDGDVLSGRLSPEQVMRLGGLESARKGDVFDFNEFGTGNRVTGGVEFNDPYIRRNDSVIAENKAQAAKSYAGAALDRERINTEKADAELKRSKIGQQGGQTITLPDGTVISSGANIPWKYDSGSDEYVAPPTPEFPMGRRSGNISKQNAAKSLDYLVDQFRGTPEEPGPIATTAQGGPMGIIGQIGRVTDSQDAKRFENLKEQLSTELRTLFRIPGEGSLSDKEQAQYGIQLPDVGNSRETNESILNDIQGRVRLRLNNDANPLLSGPKRGQPTGQEVTREQALSEARAAIAAGADRAAVIKRLKEMGINEGGL